MKCLILGYLFLDLFYSILDGGVVLTAEYDADCLQRGLGKSPHQIHGDLPRNRDAGASLVALKVGEIQYQGSVQESLLCYCKKI